MLEEALNNKLKNIYYEIHAIYEQDKDEPFGDCYCAAVDLFEPGLTFKIYFKKEDDFIRIIYVSRWYIG